MADTAVPISLTIGELQSFIEIPFVSGSELFAIEFQLLEFTTADGPLTGYTAKVQDWSKRVWLYYEPHLPITAQWFATDPAYSLAELAELVPTTFEFITYEVTDTSVQLAAAFHDLKGRRIEASVRSEGEKPAAGMFTPTPPGVAPVNLRLLYMTGFRFLPASTDISVTIDNTALTPALLRLPGVPIDLKKFSSTRVCTGLTLAAINCAGAPVGSPMVENRHGWFEVTGGPEFGPMSGSGAFAIEMPLGVATSGQWSLRPSNDADSPGFAAELSNVAQNWRPSLRRPVNLAGWIIRKLRRRGEAWSWSGNFVRDRKTATGWTQMGRWTY